MFWLVYLLLYPFAQMGFADFVVLLEYICWIFILSDYNVCTISVLLLGIVRLSRMTL